MSMPLAVFLPANSVPDGQPQAIPPAMPDVGQDAGPRIFYNAPDAGPPPPGGPEAMPSRMASTSGCWTGWRSATSWN